MIKFISGRHTSRAIPTEECEENVLVVKEVVAPDGEPGIILDGCLSDGAVICLIKALAQNHNEAVLDRLREETP